MLGLQWAALSGAGSPVWPAAGIGLAGLLLGGVRLWPAIPIARLAAAITTGSDQAWWTEAWIALGNTGSIVLTALLLTWWFLIDRRLTAMRDVARLTTATAAGGAVTGIVGTGALMFSNGIKTEMAL